MRVERQIGRCGHVHVCLKAWRRLLHEVGHLGSHRVQRPWLVLDLVFRSCWHLRTSRVWIGRTRLHMRLIEVVCGFGTENCQRQGLGPRSWGSDLRASRTVFKLFGPVWCWFRSRCCTRLPFLQKLQLDSIRQPGGGT